MVQTVILDAFAVAIRSARGLNVTNHIVDVPGGDVTVGATDGVMVIDIGIHCAEISRGA